MVPTRGLELTCERSYDQKRVFSFHTNIYKFLARSKRARREDPPPSGILAIHAKSYQSLPNSLAAKSPTLKPAVGSMAQEEALVFTAMSMLTHLRVNKMGCRLHIAAPSVNKLGCQGQHEVLANMKSQNTSGEIVAACNNASAMPVRCQC